MYKINPQSSTHIGFEDVCGGIIAHDLKTADTIARARGFKSLEALADAFTPAAIEEPPMGLPVPKGNPIDVAALAAPHRAKATKGKTK